MNLTRDEDVLGGEPRIDGTRVGIRHVAARVIDGGQSPAHVADQLDVPLADVYQALSYYYGHIDEIRELEGANEEAFEQVRESSPEARSNCAVTGVQILLDEHVGRVFELRERGHPVEQAKDRFSEHTSDAELLTQSYREHSEPLDATTPSTSR